MSAITQVVFLDGSTAIGPDAAPSKYLSQGQVVSGRRALIEFDEDPRFLSLKFVRGDVVDFQQLVPLTYVVSIQVTPHGHAKTVAAKAAAKKA